MDVIEYPAVAGEKKKTKNPPPGFASGTRDVVIREPEKVLS